MESLSEDSFTSFPTRIHFIFFLALLHWLESPGQCLLEAVRADTSDFFLIQSFVVKYDVSCKFFMDVLDHVEEFPFNSYFANSFNQKWMLDFVRWFIFIYRDDYMVFLFHPVIG